MTLERWIGLLFLLFCCLYGYAAYFGMDHLLPPILRRAPVWPSSFPKILSVLGMLTALAVIFASNPKTVNSAESGIDYRRLTDYKIGQALALIVSMIAYALLLRPIGFIAATSIFLIGGSWILGERRYYLMIPIALIGTILIWYLVQEILGIFLSPWPRLF